MKKMLLMGSEGAGKTSMHSVIFSNIPAPQTQFMGCTTGRNQHTFKFMGSLIFNLWDCGGQENCMNNYFVLQRQSVFKGVQVIIYVFDVEESEQKMKKSLEYWRLAAQSMEQYNENGSIFVLFHKIDKIQKQQKAKKLELKEKQINEVISSYRVKVKKFFATSIWDESVYQAWSEIVQLLIPNRQYIKKTLQSLCEKSLCHQAAMFQNYYHKDGKNDLLRYEKIGNIIKQFKKTCSKYASNIGDLEISTRSFTCLISQFTQTQNLLVIYKDKSAKQAISLNIGNLGKHFDEEKKKKLSN